MRDLTPQARHQFVEETLLEELGQRQFVVVAHTVDALHHVGFDPGAVGRLDLVAVGATFFRISG